MHSIVPWRQPKWKAPTVRSYSNTTWKPNMGLCDLKLYAASSPSTPRGMKLPTMVRQPFHLVLRCKLKDTKSLQQVIIMRGQHFQRACVFGNPLFHSTVSYSKVHVCTSFFYQQYLTILAVTDIRRPHDSSRRRPTTIWKQNIRFIRRKKQAPRKRRSFLH